MENKLLGVALLYYLIPLVMACGARQEESMAAPAIDEDKIKKEIQAKEDKFAALYNAGQLKNIGYYADDAISFSQNRAPLKGKPAIIEYLKAGIDSSSRGNKIAFT